MPTLLETSSHVRPAAGTRLSSCNTSVLPARDQFEYWRSEVAASTGTIEREGPYGAPFPAAVDNYLTSLFGYARHRVGCRSSIRRDEKAIAHGNFDGFVLQYRVSGHELENTFEFGELFAPGKIRLHSLDRPFWSRNTGYENIALIVSRPKLADRVPIADQPNGFTLPEGAMTMLLRDHMVSAMNALAHASRPEAEQISQITLEVVASALLSGRHSDILESESMDGALMQAVRFCIERNLADSDLSPSFLARAVGVSRAKLFRTCKPYGSPMELIHRQRMRRAKDLIAHGPDSRITDIAAMVGYENLETFSRAFRREFGLSARDFRQACQTLIQNEASERL